MILAAALAMAAQPVPGPASCPACSRVTDAEFCAMERRSATELMPELPIQIDYMTRLDGMMVSCSLRSISLNKYVSGNMSTMREGWQAHAQAQLNSIICGNPLFVDGAPRLAVQPCPVLSKR